LHSADGRAVVAVRGQRGPGRHSGRNLPGLTLASLFIAAGGNCVGAMLGGVIAARFGITAPYWVGFVVAVLVSASTWRVFNRTTVAEAYAEPALAGATR
jgi:hypothetical protein